MKYVYQEPNEVTLHRGLRNVAPNEVDHQNLGIHWTTEHPIAKSFSLTGHPPGYGDPEKGTGTVFSGKVAESRTVKYDTKTWENMAPRFEIMHPTSEERETPVLPRSPIGNLSAAQYVNGKLTRAVYLGSGNSGVPTKK